MKGSVVIVAPADDGHARAVADVLAQEFATVPLIWDTNRLTSRDALSVTLQAQGTEMVLRRGAMPSTRFDCVKAVWWRRFGPLEIDPIVSDPAVARFCRREWDTLIRGGLDATGVPIINDPSAESSARKPQQLAVARAVGLSIPDTLMTSDPDEVRSFWECHGGRCIYKGFTAPGHRMTETRLLLEEDLADLARLRHAPIIVQEKVEKGLDIRANVFGDRVFAASVETNVPQADLDWRLDLTATWREHELPRDVCDRLVLLLRALRLSYGCIDLRMRPDGSYAFLEINPSGQFLFIEIDTGQPLTRSLCEVLLRGGGP